MREKCVGISLKVITMIELRKKKKNQKMFLCSNFCFNILNVTPYAMAINTYQLWWIKKHGNSQDSMACLHKSLNVLNGCKSYFLLWQIQCILLTERFRIAPQNINKGKYITSMKLCFSSVPQWRIPSMLLSLMIST